jgi:hypothetical protein
MRDASPASEEVTPKAGTEEKIIELDFKGTRTKSSMTHAET